MKRHRFCILFQKGKSQVLVLSHLKAETLASLSSPIPDSSFSYIISLFLSNTTLVSLRRRWSHRRRLVRRGRSPILLFRRARRPFHSPNPSVSRSCSAVVPLSCSSLAPRRPSPGSRRLWLSLKSLVTALAEGNASDAPLLSESQYLTSASLSTVAAASVLVTVVVSAFLQEFLSWNMDPTMKQFQQKLTEVELEAELLLLARHQMVENDKLRNGNREALTALRKRARTTKTSVPTPFESMMKGVEGSRSRPLVQEVCNTCGNHDSFEKTWMMFPGTDMFASIPFHAAHTILETDQPRLDFEAKKLQSIVKEKSLLISETGALADKIGPGVVRSLVTLND
ncbi:hypothetical protein HN873_013226 [Arachis hypogaea]